MHDIRAIRENPAAYAAALSRRPTVDGASEVAKIMELDEEFRRATHSHETAKATQNSLSRQFGQAKAKGDNGAIEELKVALDVAKATFEVETKNADAAKAKRDDLLARLPNIPFQDVPQGADEHANVEVRRHGEPRKFNYAPKDHADIGEKMGMMDFEAAARMSGARFVVLKGQLARMERALTQFMLDVQTEQNGYVEHVTPLIVRDHAMFGTGQLPKFEEDLFRVENEYQRTVEEIKAIHQATSAREKVTNKFEDILIKLETEIDARGRYQIADNALRAVSNDLDDALMDEFFDANPLYKRLKELEERAERLRVTKHTSQYLIPTAEVSLTNIYLGQIVDRATLPVRMTAATPCFRSEAGSAGRDTKGMIRQHQFIKVELVSITTPEESEAEHKRMTECAQGILERLELPYRTVLLCTGDMGFGARKTYDLEVWLPSQNTYREISSCSNCGDFQARRMDAKFRRAQGEKPEFVHTLNGSGLAVGRTLVAILENYQREDGKVDVPKALIPYMGGLEVIG